MALTVTVPPSPAWYVTVVPMPPFDGSVVDVVDGIDVDVLDPSVVDVVDGLDVDVDESSPVVVGDGTDVVADEVDVVLAVVDVVLAAAIPTPTAMSTATMLAIDIADILLNMFVPPDWSD